MVMRICSRDSGSRWYYKDAIPLLEHILVAQQPQAKLPSCPSCSFIHLLKGNQVRLWAPPLFCDLEVETSSHRHSPDLLPGSLYWFVTNRRYWKKVGNWEGQEGLLLPLSDLSWSSRQGLELNIFPSQGPRHWLCGAACLPIICSQLLTPSLPSPSFTFRVGAASEIIIEVASASLLMSSFSYPCQGQFCLSWIWIT